MSGSMRASYQPLRASSRRLESPFSWGFLGVLLLALELLLPMCSGDCGEPPKYKTMKPKFDLLPPVGVWFSVEYVCLKGYKPLVPPVKPTATSCQPDGSYQPPLQEACTKAYCPKLQEPPNGKLVYENGSTEFGSHVQYVCTDGYYVFGPDVLTCVDAGQNKLAWSEAPSTCEKIVCSPPPEIPEGEFTNAEKDTFEYNDTVIYSCILPDGPDGYTLVGESKLVCIGPYQWSSNAPECRSNKRPSNESPTTANDLDGGLIAVIILTVLGVAVVGTCV